MEIKGWQYYNHAAIPITAPHIPVDLSPVEDGRIWKLGGHKPLLVRYITDFDCGHETNWWYIIKDTPFDINALKAKRRYEINKGIRNYEVRKIDPLLYQEALCDVAFAAYEGYQAAHRPSCTRESFIARVENRWPLFDLYGAFDKETDALCGYARLRLKDKYIDFAEMKTIPACERKGINAALVNGVLNAYDAVLAEGGYLSDGSRSVNHETAFQDYLEKYFGFRKAYCKLHIRYKGMWGCFINCVYPFRKLILRLDRIGPIHLVNSLLKMEEMTAERGK